MTDPGSAAGLATAVSTIESVVEALRAGDIVGGRRQACAALARGVEHPLLLNLRALDHEDAGRFEEALADLRRAHMLAPGDFAILNACGLCLVRLERLEEAVECYDGVIAMRPDFAPAWFNRGWALQRLGESARAASDYARNVELEPRNALAWGAMATLAGRRGDTEAARRFASTALALQPGQAAAEIALAETELADPESAAMRLRAVLGRGDLTPFDRALAEGGLGDALDAAGRPTEAFAAYARANRIFQAESAPRYEIPGKETVAQYMQWLVPWARSVDAGRWRATAVTPSRPSPSAGHVFLIGFPRSGTTLAESVLAAHPEVVSLEEKDTLHESILAFLGSPAQVARLMSLDQRGMDRYRDAYWERVRGFGVDPVGKVFIDKFPLNTLKLPLLYRLFPDAKIVFAVRDPRDVVFSCFRRRFSLNASMYELLDLRRAASLYARAMDLAEIFRNLQSMDEYFLVYERLVGDFEAQARALCAFIGVDWRPEMAGFAARARRGDVASASSAQIARGLYADGAGQWRRFEAELAPIMSLLAPWVERFGYSAS